MHLFPFEKVFGCDGIELAEDQVGFPSFKVCFFHRSANREKRLIGVLQCGRSVWGRSGNCIESETCAHGQNKEFMHTVS
ncbi:MAG: hypothetical protein BWY82_02467 [Verrucomicrobia bacterium ADurb.Bin474]|nr:MAG: hypothetical protein BWY82_02467 [Verrucomicrobia bacterium ADurb.Bin474]